MTNNEKPGYVPTSKYTRDMISAVNANIDVLVTLFAIVLLTTMMAVGSSKSRGIWRQGLRTWKLNWRRARNPLN